MRFVAVRGLHVELAYRRAAHCRRPPNRGGPTDLAPTEEVPELRNSSFLDFRQTRRKTNFLKCFLKNPVVESVPGEHTQLFTEGFPVIFHEGLFLPEKTHFLADFMCRFRTRSRMFAFGWLAVARECLERTLGGLGLSFRAVIMISWHDVVISSYNIAIWSLKL